MKIKPAFEILERNFFDFGRRLKNAFMDVMHPTKEVGRDFFDKGQYHRVGGPAFSRTDLETNVVTSELWCIHGQPHRTDGPAFVERDRLTGEPVETAWYVNGKKIAPPAALVLPPPR